MEVGSSGLGAVFVTFLEVFSAPSYRNFVALATGWILCVGRHTISRVLQLVGCSDNGPHHSVFYRFFSRAVWDLDQLSSVLARLVLRLIPGGTVVALVDDTLTRRSGPQIWGGGMHHDAVLSSYGRGLTKRVVSVAFGHSWVIVSLYVPMPWNPLRGLAIPVLFRLYRSEKHCEAGRYRKRTELAVELLKLLIAWLPPERRLVVCGDTEYACQTVVKALPPEVRFVGPICMDAAFYTPPEPRSGRGRPRKKGRRLPSPAQLIQDDSVPWEPRTVLLYGRPVEMLIKTQKGLWYTVAGQRLVGMVVTRDPNARFDDKAYFWTEPTEVEAEQALCEYSHRWPQEVMHRNAKQELGLGEPQNGWWRRPRGQRRGRKQPGPQPDAERGAKAATRTTPFIFVVYAIVVVWYLGHGRPEDDVRRVRQRAPWYRHKTEPSFSDMLAAARRELLLSRIFAAPARLLGFARKRRHISTPPQPRSSTGPRPPRFDAATEHLMDMLAAA